MNQQSQIKILKNFPFEINLRAVRRHLGYKPTSKPDPRIVEMLDEAVVRSKELAVPSGVYRIDKIIEYDDEHIVLRCGFEIRSKQVCRMLRNCVEVMMFAVTIGAEAETEAAKLMRDYPAEALLLDTVAGEAAEGAIEYLHRFVQRDAHRRGLHLTPRFSPGYGDWSLEVQRELLSYLQPQKIGISLTESCMMIPRKSVSGVLGFGPIPGIRTGPSPCKDCAKNI